MKYLQNFADVLRDASHGAVTRFSVKRYCTYGYENVMRQWRDDEKLTGVSLEQFKDRVQLTSIYYHADRRKLW